MSRSISFLLIAAISAVVFLGCKKERSFRGANPGDEIVFGGTAGSASGFRSSKTKGCDGDSSASGALAETGLYSSNMESCVSYDSDADETYFFDWEDFEGGEGFGSSDANALFDTSDNDVQTKTEYSGHKENVGGKTYERIDWVAGDKVRIFGDNVLTSGGAPSEMVYKVTSPSIKPGDARRSSASLEKESAGTMGLRWGSGNADFYAFYPGNSPAKVSASNTPSNFDVTVKLPEEQNTFTKTTSGNHTEVRPDMELAAMMAVSRDVPPASSVQLDFLPLVTTFRITLSNSLSEDITIKKVFLVSTFSSERLSGNYKVSYTKVGGSTLSSHSVLAAHLTYISSQEVYVNLGSVPGGEVFLPKKNGGIVSSMSVTLFAVPVNYSRVWLEVELEQGGRLESHTLELRLKDSGSWLTFSPYKKYDIRVGAGKDWNVELNAEDKSLPYTGGTETINITSRKTYYSQSVSLPWKVEGYCTTSQDGAFTDPKPDWLTLSKIGGGSLTALTSSSGLNVSVSAQTATTIPDARTTALRGKSEVGTQSDPIDLSRVPLDASPFFSIQDGATASTFNSNLMNTANCYVVTRPGWYKIPVVYGNAFKNGNDNIAAYKPSGSGENFLQNFIRHDGQAITKPWIKENINLNSGVAELLWQDQPNLVQNIQLESNKKFIVFHVSQATIHEGNAVIALKESASGDIVWSWHIWVYGGNDLKAINVKNNKAKAPISKPGQDNFNFLSENLGACYDGDITSYPESKVWVKVSNGMKTEVINITRTGFTSAPKYNSPYYQWGRKDPLLPSDGTNNNKVWYDKGGASNNNLPTANWSSDGTPNGATAEIANTIKNPQTFNKSANMDNLYYNLWDTECNEIGGYNDITKARFLPVTKSVYDPCPPGFCLPPDGAFTGFTSTGKDSFTTTEFNVSGSFDKGWHFRTVLKEESGGETIFFSASGFRNRFGGGLFHISRCGDYWSGVPYFYTVGGRLGFEAQYVSILFVANCSYGYALRPVRE